MVWLSRLLMFTLALDALVRIIPRLMLCFLYLLGVFCGILIINSGLNGFFFVFTSPIPAFKYAFNYLRWVYYNQNSISAAVLLKLGIAIVAPYFFYQMFKVVARWCMKWSGHIFEGLLGFIGHKISAILPKAVVDWFVNRNPKGKDQYYFDVKNRVYVKKK